MILTNFLVGLPVMLLCLVVQAVVAFWCVRYFVRRIRQVKPKPEDYSRAGIRPLLVAMVAMMLGTFVQIGYGGGCSSCSANSPSSTKRSTTRR